MILFLALLIGLIESLRVDPYCKLNSETFHSCSCVRVGPNEVDVECQNKQWFTVPSLDKLLDSQDQSHMSVNKLELKNGALNFLNQDAFKNQQIQILALGQNNIQNVNVNAFRGLEGTLKGLDLQNNDLNLIPIWSLTFLENLQYLHLQGNQIGSLDPNTTVETKLNQLHYLYLDRNKLTKIESGSLAKFPLLVLTLSKNQIADLEKDSLPTSLNILDLSNNLIESIPYAALFNLSQLSSLDLSGNRILIVKASQNVRFKADIKLNLAGNRIRRLEEDAFASFQRMVELNLEMNQIEFIDPRVFNYVNKLEKLSLSHNRLSELHKKVFMDLSKSLKNIDLSFNEFHNFPHALEFLSSVEELNLQNNKLKVLNSQKMASFKPVLRKLNVQFNQLTKVQFEVFDGMQRLEELNLANNIIEGLGKMSFGSVNGAAASLKVLNLAGNKIEEITDPGSFLYFSSLLVLNLEFNQLRKITPDAFNRLSSLKSLNLEHNNLATFPKSSLFNLKKLANLHLNRNQIDSLPVRVFEFSPLSEVNLMWNKIRLINDQIFHASSTQKLRWMSLANNKIEEIGSNAFESLPHLTHLELQGNRLSHINPQTFNSLPKLKELNLERNDISILHDLSFNQLPLLSRLNLAHNKIANISESVFQNITRLEHLILSHNKLTHFDFLFLDNQVTNLAALDVSFNKLTRINLDNANHQLTYLFLHFNNLEFIDNFMFNSCHSLKHLDLSLNSILEIHVDAFQAAKKLKQLNLSGNQLKTIWRETFANQEMFETLDLSNNFLSNILDVGVFGRDNVIKLILKHNNFSSIPTKILGSIRNSLKELNMANNQIRSLSAIDFNGLHSIQRLILSNNKIESVEANSFEEMPWLEFLDLSNNPISSWNPHSFQRISNVLQGLNLASTGLFSLPKLTTKSLKFLNISSNKIYELEESGIDSLKKLQILDVSDNYLKELLPSTLQNLSRLKHINLNGNVLKQIEADSLKNLKELETLQISRQPELLLLPPAASFSQLVQLQNLHIYNLPQVSNYNITEILRYLPPLRTLHFQVDSFILDKQLANVDLRLMNELSIHGKGLKMIDQYALDGIRRYKFHLIIRDTSITELPPSLFDNMRSVRILDLEMPDNNIESLLLFRNKSPPFLNEHGTMLEFLNLDGNPLVCDCRIRWIFYYINYYAEHAAWAQIRHFLASSKCSDRPDGLDNLLNMYDTSNQQYAKYQQFKHERESRRLDQQKYRSVSNALDCRKKVNTLASFFSSYSKRVALSSYFWVFLYTGFMLL